jgi:phosphosulfolactate synthase (CoM biosynthesis protein A)
MFELPGPWIGGVTASDVHRFRCELIDRYGTEVNIGNVAADDLMSLRGLPPRSRRQRRQLIGRATSCEPQ